ncbi:hypothetical protein JCM9534A_62340 [Catenuloplanes indicus JCM 9534]
MLVLISIGLWACTGCTSTGPGGKSEAEVPARAHCTPLSGDPLPSMCSPHGRTTASASGRATVPEHVPAAPHDGRPTRGTGTPPRTDVTHDTGGTVPATVDEPVSPELMPEAPFSAWGVPAPWLPETGEPVPDAGEPVVPEHTAEPVPPVTEEPITRYEEPVPPEPEPVPSGAPVEAALDA